MASTVSLGHAAVDNALQAAYEKKWEESISYYKKAAGLYRKAMTETNERELQVSLHQMAEEQDRKAKEYMAYLDVALRHKTEKAASSPINVPKPRPSSSSPNPSPSSSSPVSWGGGGDENPHSSPFSTSPIPSSLWGGVGQILDGIFGSSSFGGYSPSSSPSSPPSPLDDDMVDKESIGDDFVIMGSSSAPAIPHYPLPTVSTILSAPRETDPIHHLSATPPPLSEVWDENDDDEYLETLDRDLLIQEVKRLKGQVANLMTLINEQQEVKEENDVLKKSIIQFRKEVQKNISGDRPRHQSAVWSQKEREDVVSLTESLLSAPKPKKGPALSSSGGSQQQLQKENEELRAKLKEAQLKMAIQKQWEAKRKEGRKSRP